MIETTSLADHFLIAMPALQDPNFFHGVTYICEHNENGAMGIVINRPLDMGLEEVFTETGTRSDIDAINRHPVYLGGPVQNERGFIIHQPPGNWDNLLVVSDTIGVTSSRDLLQAIANGDGRVIRPGDQIDRACNGGCAGPRRGDFNQVKTWFHRQVTG